MRRGLIVVLAIILALFTFSENEVYKKDIRNRLVIQGIGIDIESNTFSVWNEIELRSILMDIYSIQLYACVFFNSRKNCISRKKTAFRARFEKNGDFFVIVCL